MASFKTTQSIDVLNVRKIYAKGDSNSTLPANSVLVTDGKGGTVWTDAAILNQAVTFNSFNTILTTTSTFTAGLNSNTFTILDGENVGLLPTNSVNTVQLYSKSFGQIDVEGSDSIYSFDTVTGTINSNIKLVGSGIIDITTDTTQNLISIYSPNDALSTMSTTVTHLSNLNNVVSNVIQNFNSPFSNFIYDAISSFSTSLGSIASANLIFTSISSFSTSLGPTVTFPRLISTLSTFSTAMGPTVTFPRLTSTLSTFSTAMGPTVTFPGLTSTLSTFSTAMGPIVTFPGLFNTLSSFSTALGPVISLPVMGGAFSTFSTSMGAIVTNNNFAVALSTNTTANFFTRILNTSTINVCGTKQPSIQYGISQINTVGSNTISLTPYVDNNIVISVTYSGNRIQPAAPLYTSSITASNFIVFGDPSAQIHWVTYGNFF